MLTNDQIEQIRQFNRAYTRILGVMNKRVFDTDLTWPEGRILIEVGVHHLTTPMMVVKQLGLDKSYASRTINKLVSRKILAKQPSPADSRSVHLKLTDYGQAVFEDINQRSNRQVRDLLAKLDEKQQEQFFTSIQNLNRLIFPKE